MNWLKAKLDSLMSTLCGVAFGFAAWQFLEFVQQYRQRLGGHLDEAKLTVGRAVDVAGAPSQLGRAAALQGHDTALANAGPFELPFVFLRELDLGIARETLRIFQPAIPVDGKSLIYAGIGLVLGWLAWDLAKLPFRKRRGPPPGGPAHA